MRLSGLLSRVLVPFAAVTVLAGCGSSSDDAESSAVSGAGTGAPADESAAEGGDTCDELAALDISGGSFGPVQLMSRDSVITRIDSTLVPLQTVEPAAEVADEWATLQGWLEQYRAAAEALPPGGIVQDPAIIAPDEEITSAQDALTDWWFATCS